MASDMDLETAKQLTVQFFGELSKLAAGLVYTHRRHQVAMAIIELQAGDTPLEDLPKLAAAALDTANTLYPKPGGAAAPAVPAVPAAGAGAPNG